ncbi:MAG: ATP-dependent DNA helicase, partial [Acidobacteriota bacterium]|nr:ATP-dependent DNA helicase [Acidobacteriota bacterium]
MNLDQLLHTTFGFREFRANQEAVCRAATEGRDVLLVMPTGAGKSLCYQLPAVARGGPALVISPLIALMEDQAAKLTALGLRVGRIHSGRSREESREACREYLNGTLQFLFIAPERMRVPGFPQMLAKRTPSLVAIDEAHCISAWGHDFRPDYRTLGEHLPALRPAPIVALTATATPTVQRDIAAQLQLRDPALFIHGFRRSNLAIEVVEMSKPQRHGFTAKLLGEAGRRPAIVYAPSRKAAEELAGELGRSAAAYHAGLDGATRERVQTAFLGGRLEVVVATIAFGMGIDKADVRTVVHTALPASVEAFYQEIGRAGRDGLPSRTVLLHSFADRKMHEFFLERDYPPATELARVARVLEDEFLMPEPLARGLKMDPEQFQKAIEKLVAQGAAAIDVAGNVRRGVSGGPGAGAWRGGYEAQVAFRRAQLDAMACFAETAQCRMQALVRHFGDTADGLRPCGQCDVCAPEGARAQRFRAPDEREARGMRAVLAALRGASSRSTGKLHAEAGGGMERREFVGLLDALARAGRVAVSGETFVNAEGKTVPYRKAALTHEGREDGAAELVGVLVPEAG